MVSLLVAALDEELVAFHSDIPEDWRVITTGPGKILATMGLIQAIALFDPIEQIVVVGTAGKISPTLQNGVYEVGVATQHDATDIDPIVGRKVSLNGYIEFGGEPTLMNKTFYYAGTEVMQYVTYPQIIATGDAFISDPLHAASIYDETQASMVDMETYAYAYVAQRAGIPLRVFKAVSDDADELAPEQWKEHAAQCSWDILAVIRADAELF